MYLCLTAPAFAVERPADLIAVMPKYFPPIYSVSRNNVPTGYGVEFMELVAKHATLNIDYRSARSWPQTFRMIDGGRADIVPSLGITEKRMNRYVFTKPYDEFDLSIFVEQGRQGINGLSDLKGHLVGVVELNRGLSFLETKTDIETVAFSSLGQLVAALKTGEVDAVVYPSVVFENFTFALGISEAFKRAGLPLETVERGIAVRKELKALVPLLNGGIDAALASPEHSKIYDRWHPAPPAYWNTRRISLLVASLVFGFIAISLLYRYVVTRNFNKKLIRYSNFNQAIVNATSDGIVTVDSSYRIVSMNAFAETLFNEPLSALLGQPVSRLLPGSEARYLFEHILKDDQGADKEPSVATNYALETFATRNDQESFPVRVGLSRMEAYDGTNVVCTVHDESRAHEAEIRADQLINHDPLTGIMNQRGLMDRWAADMNQGADRIYCFCLGLTHMTQINSLYGRHVGDEVLVQVANVLTLAFTNDKQVQICRGSGNHFIVAVTNPVDTIEDIAQSITSSIESLKIPTTNSTNPLTIDVAMGAAIFPDHAKTGFELINTAEIAYATAKRHSFDNFSLYAKELKTEHLEGEAAYQRVKHALNEDRVTLYYQPIQTIHSGKIHHYEALVRMHDEDGTLILPADIIPVAEQFNLITQIDYKVIRLALEKLSSLKDDHPEFAIAVNLSAKHIGDAKLYDLIKTEMSRHSINFANLTFEITETAALQNFAAAREFMNDLISFGCRFALDDFGVGFTSFAQLRMLPVDIIKIDGMFIKELHKNKQDEVFVKAMTDIAHSLGKKVVAEYVENEEILMLLRKLGVDFAQGFHIARPHPDIFLNSQSNENAIS